jgi:hypothetical protein
MYRCVLVGPPLLRLTCKGGGRYELAGKESYHLNGTLDPSEAQFPHVQNGDGNVPS